MAEDILRHGSKGDAVRKLQQDLVTLGFTLDVDGHFGPATEKAVRQLQEAWGYTVDGLVGKGTQFLIEQQKGYGWKAGMPTSAKPASTGKSPS